MKKSELRQLIKEELDPIYGNDTKAYYYEIGDALPELVNNLNLASSRGSKTAERELIIFNKMLVLFNKSTLGKIM